MLALGSVKSIITDSVKNGRIHFDMHGFLTNVVLADLNLSGMPALAVGRAAAECHSLETYKFKCLWYACTVVQCQHPVFLKLRLMLITADKPK